MRTRPARVIALLVALASASGPALAAEPFTLTSTAFIDGGLVPKKYAGFHPSRQPPCGGENVSPPLAWSNAPAATKSFAIVMQDPDGGRGTGSNHWVAYDIAPTRSALLDTRRRKSSLASREARSRRDRKRPRPRAAFCLRRVRAWVAVRTGWPESVSEGDPL